MKNLNLIIAVLVIFVFGMTSCQKNNLDKEFAMVTETQRTVTEENTDTDIDVFDGMSADLPEGVKVYNEHSAYIQKLNKQFQQTAVAQSRNGFVDNGEDVVFCGGTLIAVQQADGTGTRILLDVKSYDSRYNSVTSPVWSNDGTMIAFAAKNKGTSADIFIMNADGSNLRMIFSGNYVGYFIDGTINDLSWRSDNRSLLFKIGLVQSYATYKVGFFQYEYNFDTGESQSGNNGYNTVGAQYEPFLNGTQYAFRKESYLSEKLYIGNTNSTNTEVWWDFETNYSDLTTHNIREIAWNNSNSVYTIIESGLSTKKFEAYRVDKIGNSFQATSVFNSSNTPMTAITVSPNKHQLYSALETNEGSIMYLIQLDGNGNFVSGTPVGPGAYPNWRLVKPASNGRSNAKIVSQRDVVVTQDLIREAVQLETQDLVLEGENLPSGANAGIFAGGL